MMIMIKQETIRFESTHELTISGMQIYPIAGGIRESCCSKVVIEWVVGWVWVCGCIEILCNLTRYWDLPVGDVLDK